MQFARRQDFRREKMEHAKIINPSVEHFLQFGIS